MKSEETIDELCRYGLHIEQPRDGYRFSVDPLLLCDFAAIRPGERVIDLGCGCGVMPLVLARQAADVTVCGVEFQEPMAELALRNVRSNNLGDRISILPADITTLKGMFPVSSFDLVVSNPPYRRPGTGRISPRAGRDKARHESTATLADFLAMAKYLVKPGGRICFIYHPSRLVELFSEAALIKLCPLQLRFVHGNGAASAGMFLVEMAKGRRGDLTVMPPLLVHGENDGYSPEMQRLYCGNTKEQLLMA